MLNAIPRKCFNTPTVKTYWKIDGELALWLSQSLSHILREVKLLGSQFKLLYCHAIWIKFGNIFIHRIHLFVHRIHLFVPSLCYLFMSLNISISTRPWDMKSDNT